MLKSLHIQNYAIIEAVDIALDKGLTIITGETGAGKSILLGALGLIMGRRAETAVLYDKSKNCVVEAEYDLSDYNLKDFFANNNLDYNNSCVIRRMINPSGKSRAFINDIPANLNILKELNKFLVDLHQQFDTLEINNEDFQIKVVDALAGNNNLLKKYINLYRKYKANISNLNKLKEKNNKAKSEADFNRFQLNEFLELKLEIGEEEKLSSDLKKIESGDDVRNAGHMLKESLEESDPSAISLLEEIYRLLRPLSEIDNNAAEAQLRIDEVIVELKDIVSLGEKMIDTESLDPEQKIIIEERLDTINRLLIKHRVQSDVQLIEIQDNLESTLQEYDNMDAEINQLEESINKDKEILSDFAKSLTANRLKAIPRLEKKINSILDSLSMKNAKLSVDLKHSTELRKNGADNIAFLFTANKGSAPLPIEKVASGGELSRLNLAIKSTIAEAITLPTLIFDEIDTGVSGQVALMMGNMLRSLSEKHQTICITHSPQVASKANCHLHIYKSDEKERTLTHIRKLEENERGYEIAKMLSGDPPSDEALSNANQLLTVG